MSALSVGRSVGSQPTCRSGSAATTGNSEEGQQLANGDGRGAKKPERWNQANKERY